MAHSCVTTPGICIVFVRESQTRYVGFCLDASLFFSARSEGPHQENSSTIGSTSIWTAFMLFHHGSKLMNMQEPFSLADHDTEIDLHDVVNEINLHNAWRDQERCRQISAPDLYVQRGRPSAY